MLAVVDEQLVDGLQILETLQAGFDRIGHAPRL
jgi:hypothetical protein